MGYTTKAKVLFDMGNFRIVSDFWGIKHLEVKGSDALNNPSWYTPSKDEWYEKQPEFISQLLDALRIY